MACPSSMRSLRYLLQELTSRLLPALEEVLLTHLTKAIMTFIVPDGAGISDVMVQSALKELFSFSFEFRKKFMLAFDNRKAAKAKYSRCGLLMVVAC